MAKGKENKPFQHLTEILFEEDRRVQQKISEEVGHLQQDLNDPEAVKNRVTPFIEEKIDFLRDNFPEEFGPVITSTIRKQILESRDEVIDALYPIMGQLIRKYILKELERLSERVDQQVDDAFSWKSWKNKIKSWFTGVQEQDMIIRDMAPPVIEQVFIVARDSGLLMGNWSLHETIDRDMVAAMLTAIKSFVEDAISGSPENLEMVEYETNKISLQNFPKFYIACVISGVVTANFKGELIDQNLELAQKLIKFSPEDITDESQQSVLKVLETVFGNIETE